MSNKGIQTIPGTYDSGSSNYIIKLYSYDKESSQERVFNLDLKDRIIQFDNSLELIRKEKNRNHVIIINNYFDTELLDKLKNSFCLHSLTLEDVVNTHQRCKYESYNNYEFCIIPKYSSNIKIQISLLITKEVVIIFNPEEKDDETINLVTDRIIDRKGRIFERDLGYTAYAFLDALIDTYFNRIEELENEQDLLDSSIETGSEVEISKNIFDLKRKVLEFKKTTWPLREMINSILRDENSLLLKDERNVLFYRDLQDHTMRVSESSDALRDMVYSLVEMHMNSTSIRMNSIMKVLTIMTTIFTPIMFLSSVYGMNFDKMPEIHIKHGYEWFWLIIITISLIQIYFFKRKKWL